MTVKEFLERVQARPSLEAANTVMDLMKLLDEFDSEPCSTLVGKIRGQMVINTRENNSKRSPLELHREAVARRAKEEQLKKRPGK